VRRDLGQDVIRQIGEAIQKSIQYGLEHREEALAYALPFARGMDAERAQKFIGMYVNDYTVDFGRTGFKAIKTFLDRGYREGILKEAVDFDGCVFDVRMWLHKRKMLRFRKLRRIRPIPKRQRRLRKRLR
jgi:predicted solute-binding protein